MSGPAPGRLAADAAELTACVADALARRQHGDGFWREFALQPGASESWCTAWIAWGLAHASPTPVLRHALHQATRALLGCARPQGWGYNRVTGCDADSTAWTTLLLATTAPAHARAAAQALLRYVDPAGNAHTFDEPRFGDWCGAHGEVTAVALLALCAAGCAPSTLALLRTALCARAPVPFWWDTAAYGHAWRVVALAGTGGVPSAVLEELDTWLLGQGGQDASAFDHALQLLALASIAPRHADLAAWHAHRLLAAASCAGWPGSCSLLVPPQGQGGNNDLPRGPHRDDGTMTSALALAALARWRRNLPAAA